MSFVKRFNLDELYCFLIDIKVSLPLILSAVNRILSPSLKVANICGSIALKFIVIAALLQDYQEGRLVEGLGARRPVALETGDRLLEKSLRYIKIRIAGSQKSE